MNAREAVGIGVTATLAAFVAETRLEVVPSDVVAAAKRSLADAIGVSVAGARQPGPRILAAYVRDLDAAPLASVIGHDMRSTPALAAWVNGTSADVLGWADFSVVHMNHPSAAIAPAVVALGEAIGASGSDMLLAYLLGVEISNKLAQGVKPGFHVRGWHALGVCNTFGSAAAASRLLRLDAHATANALGIAGADASGMKASMVTMTKSYVAGAAGRDGIEAAQLAKRGFTGPANVIEGRDGFLQTFGAGAAAENVLRDLGNPFEFISPGLTLKLYPSCTHTHTAIAAALRLRHEHGIAPDAIESVTCSVTPVVYDFLAWPSPRNAREAKFSMQFCVATALIKGDVRLSDFTDEAVDDPATIALMKRIEMVISPEFAALGYNPVQAPSGCIMTVRLTGGGSHTERMERGPWEPPRIPAWNDLLDKFVGASAGVLDADAARRAFSMLQNIDTLARVDELTTILRGGNA